MMPREQLAQAMKEYKGTDATRADAPPTPSVQHRKKTRRFAAGLHDVMRLEAALQASKKRIAKLEAELSQALTDSPWLTRLQKLRRCWARIEKLEAENDELRNKLRRRRPR